MKKMLLVTALAALGSGPAFAADLEPRTYSKAPLMADPSTNWTGFYAGVNAGWASGGSGGSNTGMVSPASTASDLPTVAAMAAGVTSSFRGSNGFIGGGQFGYNYQFSPLFVAGFEADIQGLSSRSNSSSSSSLPVVGIGGSTVGFATNVTNTLDPSYVGTFRARLGVTVIPSVLLYVTGGLAYGGARSDAAISQSGINADNPAFTISPASGSFSGMRVGYAAGAGAEWMFASHWSAKLEYLYYDLGSETYSTGSLAGSAFEVTRFVGDGNGVVNTSTTVHLRNNIVRAGVNYHFN